MPDARLAKPTPMTSLRCLNLVFVMPSATFAEIRVSKMTTNAMTAEKLKIVLTWAIRESDANGPLAANAERSGNKKRLLLSPGYFVPTVSKWNGSQP
jgi:hypothetical protein